MLYYFQNYKRVKLLKVKNCKNIKKNIKIRYIEFFNC